MANVAKDYKIITCLHKHYDLGYLVSYFKDLVYPDVPNEWDMDNYNLEDLQYVWYSLGIQDKELSKLEDFIQQTNIQPNLCVDVANGHIDSFVDKLKLIRGICPNSIIMAGNVVLEDMIYELIHYGKADIIKVGLGSGSRCLTRSVSGIGMPQLSACINSSNTAHGLKKEEKRLALVCGDGGIKEIGDFAKGFGTGSDFLMAGGMFQGFEENEGEWVEYNCPTYNMPHPKETLYGFGEKKYRALKVYGMSSKTAQEKHDEFKDYRASEGDEAWIGCKGEVEPFIKEILGGLRSACTYVGATCLKDFAKCTTFIKTRRIK